MENRKRAEPDSVRDAPMRVVATVEARMTSSRFPGKVLVPIAGKPALEHLVNRLRRIRRLDEVVIATTVNATDDPIEELSGRLGVSCYRGSEEDVMDRVTQAAASVRAEAIVEVTGDCPLLAPEVIASAVERYLSGGYDLVSNTWRPSYPQGADAQVFGYHLLEEALRKTADPAHHEHVSLYFYEHPEVYRIFHLEAPPEFRAPELRFQLDTAEDLRFIRAVYEELYPLKADFSLPEIFALLRRKPDLKRINASVKEKPVRVAP